MLRAPISRSIILVRNGHTVKTFLSSHRRFITSTIAEPASHSGRSQRSSQHSQSQHLSGIALALSTAASCSAILSARTGTLRADFSTLSSPLGSATTTEMSVERKMHTGANSPVEITLYQYEVCPFCNKVRAYLDYHNIPYKVVEVDPLRKTELKQFSDGYRKVPIAIVNGAQINGSANIIDHVHEKVKGEAAKIAIAEQKWVNWVDNHLIRLISPNIYRTVGESLQTFDYIANNAKFSAWQRASIKYSGAAVMYMIGKKKKGQYKIEDERMAMHDALAEWTEAVQEKGKFFAGDSGPGIADLSVYGVLKAIETFDTFAELREKNVAFCEWYDRTQAAVGDTSITERA